MASSAGTPVPAIARLVAAAEVTVRDVIHAFKERGLAALDPRWAGGRPRLNTDDDIAFIVTTATTRPGKPGLAVHPLEHPQTSGGWPGRGPVTGPCGNELGVDVLGISVADRSSRRRISSGSARPVIISVIGNEYRYGYRWGSRADKRLLRRRACRYRSSDLARSVPLLTARHATLSDLPTR
jgi:hypothetical protein